MSEFVAFILQIDIFRYISLALCLFFLHLLILRNVVFNIFDPLVVFCLFNSLAISVVGELDLSEGRTDRLLYLLFFSAFFLWGITRFNLDGKKEELFYLCKTCLSGTSFFYSVLFWLLFISSSIFWCVRGIPIFSDNPSDAKVLLYQGGFGIVRYIQTIVPPLICFYAIFQLCFSDKPNNLYDRICLCSYIIFSCFVGVLSGAKSSLIFLVYIFSYVMWFTPIQSNLYRKMRRTVILLLGLIVVISIYVLFLSNADGDPSKVFVSFAVRLAAGGDAYFLWFNYNLDQTLSRFDIVDFLKYLANPMLSMLGLVEPDYPLGAIVLNESVGFPLSSFGPNSSLPIVSSYFASGGEFFLAAFFGVLMGWCRIYALHFLRRWGGGGAGLGVFLWMSSTSIFIDVNYFAAQLTAFLFVILPVYIVIRLFRQCFTVKVVR